jgi:hypothetical protein
MLDRIRNGLELFARAGYTARGFVYVSIGVLALLAALEYAPRPGGTDEAIAMFAGWPFGRVWLTAIAAGLAGFAAWRALQSVLDADRQGAKPKALASRAGQAVSGLTYGALAFSMYQALDAVEDAGEAGGGAEAGAAQVLALPLGGALLLIAGLFVAAVGVGGLIRGARGDFCRRLGCRGEVRTWADRLGRAGYAGRGLAFLPVGFFLIQAGLTEEASRARSLGATLQTLEGQTYGSLVLILVALGLIAFGLYAIVEGRYRRIDVPDPTRRRDPLGLLS